MANSISEVVNLNNSKYLNFSKFLKSLFQELDLILGA